MQPGGARVAVTWERQGDALRSPAVALARRLKLPFFEGDPLAQHPFDLLLTVRSDRLELREPNPRARALYVDLVRGMIGHRRKSGPSGREPIARAVGSSRGGGTIVDATAGMARDSFVLAELGWTVVAVERSAVLAALVRDGLERASSSHNTRLQDTVKRIQLVDGDARVYLANLDPAQSPQIVYLDPMYPPKKKSALPKKEMRICRALVGNDPDAHELFVLARRKAARRVVVKRHPLADPLAPDPDLVFRGKAVRYDVYLCG